MSVLTTRKKEGNRVHEYCHRRLEECTAQSAALAPGGFPASIQTPDGRTISIPPTVNGISTGATHFTLMGGSTPTLVSGRTFQASDATSYVAMMSQKLAQNNHLTVGSTFTLKGKSFTIIGLYTTDQQFADNSLLTSVNGCVILGLPTFW